MVKIQKRRVREQTGCACLLPFSSFVTVIGASIFASPPASSRHRRSTHVSRHRALTLTASGNVRTCPPSSRRSAARTCRKTNVSPNLTRFRALKFVRGDDYTPETEIAGTRNEQVAFIVTNRVQAAPGRLPPRNASFEDDGKKNAFFSFADGV